MFDLEKNILLKIIVVEGPLSALRLVSDQLFIKCIEMTLHYNYVGITIVIKYL